MDTNHSQYQWLSHSYYLIETIEQVLMDNLQSNLTTIWYIHVWKFVGSIKTW